MRERDLPNLWIPGLSRFVEVAEIPMLQTGKLDLTGIRAVANERFVQSQSE
jgi:acyl-[acyl-carrier-protein]-phospholipid O-acyltransferase/long-chain-fatty-acid--[acyl-carrier-protein] ligase